MLNKKKNLFSRSYLLLKNF